MSIQNISVTNLRKKFKQQSPESLRELANRIKEVHKITLVYSSVDELIDELIKYNLIKIFEKPKKA